MKKLLYGFQFAFGRNRGLISSYHRGGGHKHRYRVVDRFRFLYPLPAKVLAFHYDPCRSVVLALLLYTNGILSYLPATSGLHVNSFVPPVPLGVDKLVLPKGLSCTIRFIRPGVRISNLELYPSYGASIVRSGGLFASVVRRYEELSLVKLSSGEYRFFSVNCLCTVGSLQEAERSSFAHKAGYNRWYGNRPVVRGRAMNPVDHPHGGRTNGGMVPTTPWARTVKGQRTSRSTTTLRLKKF
jgi:large subunit ribosomal protein L2